MSTAQDGGPVATSRIGRRLTRTGVTAGLAAAAVTGALLSAPGTALAASNLSCDGTNVRLVQVNSDGSQVLQNEIGSISPGGTLNISLSRAAQFAYVTHTGTVKPNSKASFTYYAEAGFPVYAYTTHSAGGNGVIAHEQEIKPVSDIALPNETLRVVVLFETNNCGKVGGDIGFLHAFP